jgi:hypothetical protein
LLLPAIQAVRESANRIECTSNLRQLAIAVQLFALDHGDRMPTLTDTTPGTPTGAHLVSFYFQLLPDLEQNNLRQQFDPANPSTYYGASSASPGPVAAILPLLLCPSDSSDTGRQTYEGITTFNPPPTPPFQASFSGMYAPTSYVANGLVFRSNVSTYPNTFVNGTSNTIIFAERYRACGGTNPLWGYGANAQCNPSFGFLPLSSGYNSGMFAPNVPLQTDASGNVLGQVGTAPLSPGTTTKPVPFQVRPSASNCDPSMAQSAHAGGMQVALADGSARGVSGNVSQYAFWASCTPSSSDTAGSDW